MLNVLFKIDQCAVEMYPAWPIWSWDLAPSTLNTYPPSLSAWDNGDSVYWQPSRRMDLDSRVEIRSQPNTDPVIMDNVHEIIFIPSRKLSIKCLLA
jgi:hypothetical protein